MAIPTYFGSGTFTPSLTTATPPFPASTQADDIALLVCESENEAITLTTANGFAELGDQANKASGTVAAVGSNRIAVYWKRLAGGDSDPVVADPGNHVTAQIHVFRGCITSGNPWDVFAEGADDNADAVGPVPGATTTVADCLVVLICGSSRNATSTAEFTWGTNSDLANITERTDNIDTIGVGGGHGMATGEKASAGSYAATNCTLTAASHKGMMSIALKPTTTTQNLTGTLFTKAPTFFTGVVTPGAVSLTGTLFTKAPTFFTGTVTHGLSGVAVGYLRLPDATGARASTPDHASLDITGDIDIRALAWFTDDVGFQAIVAKGDIPLVGGTGSYALWRPDGTTILELGWDNPTQSFSQTSAISLAVDGAWRWYRATLDVDNGSSQKVVTFYRSDDPVTTDPASVSWTQHSQHTLAGTTSIRAGTDELWLGDQLDEGDTMDGRIGYVEIRDGIGGTIVASPDFRDHDERTSDTTLVDTQGKTWTVASPAFWHLPYFKASTFFTGALSATYSLTGTLFQKVPTFFTGVVSGVAGDQTLNGVLFTKAPTFFTGAVTSTYALTGALYQNTPTFFTGSVTSTYALTGTLFQRTPTFFTGTITLGAALLSGVLFQKAPTFFTGSVTTAAGPQTISGVLFTKAPTFFTGAVLADQTVTGSLFQKAPTFFAGSVSSVYPLTGTLFQKAPTFFTGNILADQSISGVLYQNTPVFFVGVFAPAGSLFGNLYQNTPVFFGGAMSQSGGSFWRVNPAGYTLNPVAYTVNGAAYDPILGGELPPWAIEVDGEVFVLDPLFFAGSVS